MNMGHTSHAWHSSKHIAQQHASHIFINFLMNRGPEYRIFNAYYYWKAKEKLKCFNKININFVKVDNNGNFAENFFFNQY